MSADLPKGAVRRRTAAFLRPYRRLVAGAVAGMVGATLVTVAGPALVKYAIDHGIRRHDTGALDRAALAYLGLVLARPLLERAIVLCSARAGERFLGDLRVAAFEHLQRLSLSFFEGERAGTLISRLTADVQTLTEFTRQVLIEVVGSLLLLALTIVALVVLSPVLSLVTLISLPLLLVSAVVYQRRSRPTFLALRDHVAETLTSLQEGLTGMQVVQSFSRERDHYELYRRRSSALVRSWRRVSLVNVTFFPVIAFAQAIGTAAVLLAGGILYRRGDVSIGTVVAFTLYLLSLFDPIARLGDWFTEFQSGRAALTKIVGLLETPVSVVERAGARELPGAGALAVERLDFAYEGGPPVLTDVDLAIEPGEHLALVGATGAGKSTLAKLLTRQYDAVAGTVAFGGVDLRDATLASVRRRIAFVPQEGHLFSGTIADNVRLADARASDEDVAAALAQIGVLERFDSLPDGIGTDVQTHGVRLSSGERQLVGLARVALADPAVLVLDEATSSLDPGTEVEVERALRRVTEGRTVVTIVHRLSTARRCDRIAVLEHGRLVELGTHAELLAREGRYAALWASWESRTEDAA